MHIHIEELEHSYKVRFPYNAQAVERVKTIPGRQFRKDMGNAWLIPKSSQRALERFCREFDGTAASTQVARPYRDPARAYPTCSQGPEHWPHQIEAFRFLVNREAALIDLQMGTGGKSRIIVDYVCNTPELLRACIVCPYAVIPAWQTQFERYAGKPARVHLLNRGSVADKAQAVGRALLEQKQTHITTPLVFVVNYESVWRDPLGELLLDAELDLLVLDEVQRAKGAGTACGKFCYRLGAAVPTRIGLSGTPFPHEPIDDSYGVYRALDPTIFGTSLNRHRARYAIMGGFENKQIVGRVSQLEMQQKINSIRFHVDVDESKLPPELHTDIAVDLPEKVRKLYKQLSNDFYAKVGSGEITAANAAVAVTRLQQITSGYVPIEHEETGIQALVQLHRAKQDALLDFLSDLPESEPVVVFCRFRRDLEQVHEVAQKLGRASSELSGRRHELEAWQRGDTVILATQLRAGSVGVDMTRAHIAVYFSYSFSLEEYAQSLRRLRRPGQNHTVLFYHLIVSRSVDDRIRSALERRQDVIDVLMKVPNS